MPATLMQNGDPANLAGVICHEVDHGIFEAEQGRRSETGAEILAAQTRAWSLEIRR